MMMCVCGTNDVPWSEEDFLQQNSFTAYDKYCPFYKSAGMLRNMIKFHTLSNAAVEAGSRRPPTPPHVYRVLYDQTVKGASHHQCPTVYKPRVPGTL